MKVLPRHTLPFTWGGGDVGRTFGVRDIDVPDEKENKNGLTISKPDDMERQPA